MKIFKPARWLMAGLAVVVAVTATSTMANARPPRCSTAEDARRTLLDVHRQDREAHLTGRVELMAANWSRSILSARNGKLQIDSADQLTQRFRAYFGRFAYSRWDATQPPDVRVSADGTLGWMVVSIDAEFYPRDDRTKAQRFVSSWIATFEREDCAWKMTGMSSDTVNTP